MKTDGKFVSPLVSHVHTPMAISGDGSCEVTHEGLRVRGFKSANTSLLVLGGLIGFMVLFFVTSVTLPQVSLNAKIGAVTFFAVTSGLSFRHRANTKRPLEFLVPWSSVRKVTVTESDIQILVKRHRPSGMLHFQPREQREAFVEMLNKHRESHQSLA